MTGEEVGGLQATAAKSAAWTGATAMLVRLLRLVSFFLLARLVAPTDFGVLALAAAVVAVGQVAGGLGLHQYVIRAQSLTDLQVHSAFWLSAGLGLAISAASAAAAPLMGLALDEPSVTPVMLALSPLPLVTALAAVPTGLLWRKMRYRSLATRNLVAAGVSTVASLALALNGAGVWALVAQLAVEAVVGTAMLWLSARAIYMPRLAFSRVDAQAAAGFGWRVVGGDLLAVTSYRSDDFIVGARLGAASLGVYSVAYRILTVLRETMQATAGTVAFSIFARLQHDPTRLAHAFKRALNVLAAVTFPVYVSVAAAAPVIVDASLGPTWQAAAPVVTALALVGLAASVTDLVLALLVALGHARDTLRFALVNTGLNLLAFLVAVHYGIVWVAVAFTIRGYVVLPYVLHLLRRRTGLALRDVLGSLAGATAACVPVAAIAWWLGSSVSARPSYASVALVVVVTVPTYLLALRLLAPRACRELLSASASVLSR